MPISRRTALATTAALAMFPAAVLAANKKKEESAMPESEPFGRFTVDQVERRMGQPNVHVYDGNGDETYHEAHVPGSVRLYSKTMKPSDLPADKSDTLVFYCHNLL